MSDLYAPVPESFTRSSAELLIEELRRRGVTRIRAVRLRANRTRLLSLSADRSTLNAHVCFAEAPAAVLDAIAEYLTSRPSSTRARRAVERICAWEGVRRGLEAARELHRLARGDADGARVAPQPGPCCASPPERRALRELFERLNSERFGGRLPPSIPIRLSARMTRSFGHIRYHRTDDGRRMVVEIAIRASLLRRRDPADLEETVLHEMAHAEAWLVHGHAGHGRIWRSIARRVGCIPRACRVPLG